MPPALANVEDPLPLNAHSGGFGESGWGSFLVIALWAHVLLPHSQSLEAPRKAVWRPGSHSMGRGQRHLQEEGEARLGPHLGGRPAFHTPAWGSGPTGGSPSAGILGFPWPAECNVASRTVQAPCTTTSQAAAASP